MENIEDCRVRDGLSERKVRIQDRGREREPEGKKGEDKGSWRLMKRGRGGVNMG